MISRHHSYSLAALSLVGAALLGPPLNAQWVHTAGPAGGNVTCFLVNGSTVYAGTGSGGIYASVNMGSSWIHSSTGLAARSIQVIMTSGGRLYAGTSAGVFVSPDNGSNWNSLGTTFQNVSSLASTGTTLLAGVFGDGVYVSTDTGASWHQTLFSQSISCLTVNGANIFAGTNDNGVLLSTDNGGTWNPVRAGLTGGGLSISTFMVRGPNLFAGTAGGLFVSTNNGTSWTTSGSGLSGVPVSALTQNSLTLFAGTAYSGVYLSTDYGSSWNPANAGLRDPHVGSLAWDATILLAGTVSGGVYMSTDGALNWIYASDGIPEAPASVLARNGTTIFSGTSGAGVFTTANDGASWSLSSSGLPDPNVWAFAFSGQSVFAGTSSGVYRSTNNGSFWTAANTGISGSLVYALAQSPGGLFAGVLGGSPGAVIFRSTDNGATWTPAGNGLGSTASIFALLARGSKLFAGTDVGVFVSTDNGAGWTGINAGLGAIPVYSIADSGALMYAGGSAKIFRTTNEGAAWTDVSAGLPGNLVTKIIVVGENVIAGFNGGGIYCSNGGGGNWRAANAGLNDLRITSVAPSGIFLLAGSAASAVWRRPLYEVVPPDRPVATAASSVSAIGFTANWNFSAGAARYILDVSADTAFGSFVTGYNGLDVGISGGNPVTGLTPQTTYFYRVRAANGVGPSGNSNTISVRTLQSPPARPALRSPSNVTQTGFTANWMPSTGAVTYRLDVASDIGFSTFVAGYKDLDVGVDTSYGVTGLTPSTDYFFQVRGVNGAGPGQSSSPAQVTTLANVPAAPTATSPTGITNSGFTANWSSASGATSYDLDVATDASFSTFVSGYNNRNVGFTTSFAVGSIPEATVYYYRVRGRNSGGPGPNSNMVSATTLRSYPPTFLVAATVPFSSASKALSDYLPRDYQLIGIPGNSGVEMDTILGGTQGSDWEIYWDNGTSVTYPGYYVRLKSGDGRFAASTGKAFWLLHLGNWALNRSVSAAALDTAGDATLGLTAGAGFNLITNPFLYPVPWSRITSANGITDSIAAWTSSGWVRAASFDPYKGYLFFNGSGKASLRIPLNATLPKMAVGKPQETGSWRVDVIAHSGPYIDQTTSFGISPDALAGFDGYEQRKPRHFTEIPDVYFRRQEWDVKFPEFATDVRGPLNGIGIWDMSVRSEDMKRVDVEFRGIDRIPDGLDVMMLDESAGYAQDLRVSHTYVLNPHSPITELKVAVGKPGEVRSFAASVLPSRFALRQNFPNPFNLSTIIPVDIPAQSYVALEIFDLLGRRVVTLFGGEISAGRHYFEWNGTNSAGLVLSSGVYFTRLSLRNGRTLVARMNLIK
jgi:hypothetical protein